MQTSAACSTYFADHSRSTPHRRELRRGRASLASSRRCSICSFIWCATAIASSARTISRRRFGAAAIVSESTLTSRINAARRAVGDSGDEQRLIRTVARKGMRFVCAVRTQPRRPRSCGPSRRPSTEQSRTALPLPDRPAIAVLPFTNMSGEPEQEYFSDGISEDIITALSKLRWFFVIARNSSFTYKGKAVHMQADRRGARRRVTWSKAACARTAIACASPLSSTMSRPAATSGPSATTASWRTSSRSRTRSPRPSLPRSSRSSMRRRIFARSASRPTAWMPGTW